MSVMSDRIKQARNQAHMTQRELANAAHISRSYLASLEAGRYNPSMSCLLRVAAATGKDLNFLSGMFEISTSEGANSDVRD